MHSDIVATRGNGAKASQPLKRRHAPAAVLASVICVLSLASSARAGKLPPCSSAETVAVDRALLERVRGRELEEHVRFLAGISPPRDFRHPDVLERISEHIAGKLRGTGARVLFQEFTVDGDDYRNVRALFGPETPSRVIVGAHYDVAGPLPGADDNASGVAALLVLADLLGRTQLKSAVELVAFTLEEAPFFRSPNMGSARHARHLKSEGVEVRAMIALEMLGFYSNAPDSQSYPVPSLARLYPDRGDFIALVGRIGQEGLVNRVCGSMASIGGIGVYKLAAPPAMRGVDFSDHASYWDEGFPAVMVTDTAFYRNPNYHRATDTPETLDYGRMQAVVKQVYAAVLELAR